MSDRNQVSFICGKTLDTIRISATSTLIIFCTPLNMSQNAVASIMIVFLYATISTVQLQLSCPGSLLQACSWMLLISIAKYCLLLLYGRSKHFRVRSQIASMHVSSVSVRSCKCRYGSLLTVDISKYRQQIGIRDHDLLCKAAYENKA